MGARGKKRAPRPVQQEFVPPVQIDQLRQGFEIFSEMYEAALADERAGTPRTMPKPTIVEYDDGRLEFEMDENNQVELPAELAAALDTRSALHDLGIVEERIAPITDRAMALFSMLEVLIGEQKLPEIGIEAFRVAAEIPFSTSATRFGKTSFLKRLAKLVD